jgi:uncharacterized cupin superfamily protein
MTSPLKDLTMPDNTIPVAVRALDVSPPEAKTGYPKPFHHLVEGREKRRLGEAFGLTNYGVNLYKLGPGALSSLRHAHSAEDEFVYVIEGSPTLVTNESVTVLAPGMCAGFKAGTGNAHHLRNDSTGVVWYIEVGDRKDNDQVVYPDVDLALHERDGHHVFTHKNGEPYADS